jgi:hypothetical protein
VPHGRKITTQHQWIDKLERLIPEVAPLNLRRQKDVAYMETVNGTKSLNDSDAYNFSNSLDHDGLVQRAVKGLLKQTNPKFVGQLLGELTFRKTYGAFSELAAYDWLERAGIAFTPQVALGASDVVNPNGSTLDGRLHLGDQSVYFDVKAFGFVDHKVSILQKKLNDKFAGEFVTVERDASISIDDVQVLLERAGFDALTLELVTSSRAQRGVMRFAKKQGGGVSVETTVLNPQTLANENPDYALRFGSQFTRQAPFMLFFVIHPWFSKGALHQNVFGYADDFTRGLAELTFTSFEQDVALREGLPTRDLARLLSAIAFINVWPQSSSAGQGPTARIHLNPNANAPLSVASFGPLARRLGSALHIELSS